MQTRIREIRENKRIPQKELSDKLNISQSRLSNWETGISAPRADMLPAIANALGCTIDELFNYEWNSNNFTGI